MNIIPFPAPVAYTYGDGESDRCDWCGNWQCTCPNQNQLDEYARTVLGAVLDDAPELVATRRAALADMLATGFVDQAAVATVVDDVETEDDAAGWEDGPETRIARSAVELLGAVA